MTNEERLDNEKWQAWERIKELRAEIEQLRHMYEVASVDANRAIEVQRFEIERLQGEVERLKGE